jgi:uncharacterized protein YndB with AHSA1/START domain
MTSTYDLARGFTVARTIAATPAEVFRSWTDPDHMGWYFNPSMPAPGPADVDLRTGGAWRLDMVINAELDYITGGIYRDIEPSSLLAFFWGAVGGWPELAPTDTDPTGLAEAPLVTITLADAAPDGTDAAPATEQVFRLALPDHLSETQVGEWLALGIRPGWTETIDRLVTKYAGDA